MAKANSTRKYIEFNKADLSPACKKFEAELAKLNKAAAEVRELYVKQVEADHGAIIKTAHEGLKGFEGYVYDGIGTNFGKLSGMYDLPGAAKKSSSKALGLK